MDTSSFRGVRTVESGDGADKTQPLVSEEALINKELFLRSPPLLRRDNK